MNKNSDNTIIKLGIILGLLILMTPLFSNNITFDLSFKASLFGFFISILFKIKKDSWDKL